MDPQPGTRQAKTDQGVSGHPLRYAREPALRLVDLAGEEATREMLTSRYGPELAADAAREARSLTANVAPRAESVAAGA